MSMTKVRYGTVICTCIVDITIDSAAAAAATAGYTAVPESAPAGQQHPPHNTQAHRATHHTAHLQHIYIQYTCILSYVNSFQ